MNELTYRLSSIVGDSLPKKHTSISYGIMIDGEIVAVDALGTQGKPEDSPATLECTYNVASISKIYCSVAVMQLAEKGKVDLDEPIVTYLPDFVMEDPRHRDITLRHCLSHTSGLPGTQWRGFSVSDLSEPDYYGDVYDYLSKSSLKAAPGEYAVYCNDGFTLAEMVVAKVSGLAYSEYCKDRITDPIGAPSTRLSDNRDENYPLVREGDKPGELLMIQGAAGITTNMTDLCRFGNLFLGENQIISMASMEEMAKPQGRTFLSGDDRTELFGLGWDNVDFRDPDYDLGDGVLLKGGNSFQFTTQFMVIPKHRTVLAISETHDCKLDVCDLGLKLLSVAMMDRGINIHTRGKTLTPEEIQAQSGTYLVPSGILNFKVNGVFADAVKEGTNGSKTRPYRDLVWNGHEWESLEDRISISFDGSEDDSFMMLTRKCRTFPIAMKAKEGKQDFQFWRDRVGKSYIADDLSSNDMVIHENMTAFTVSELPGYSGIYLLSFAQLEDSDVYDHYDAPVMPLDDHRGQGFLKTPTNGSRDLLDPRFYAVGGVEYCDVASYRYRDVSSLPVYQGDPFPSKPRENQLYRIGEEIKELPTVPLGNRLMILDTDLKVVYDSLFPGDYSPVDEGYISLI